MTEYAVVRLRELLVGRMQRNARSPLSEVWVAGGRFSEPEAELVEHLIHHREELSSWMRTVLAGEPGGQRWEQSPGAFLSSLLAPWLQERNQFLRVDSEAARQLEVLYLRAIAETELVLSSGADDTRAAGELQTVWDTHRGRLVSFVRSLLDDDPRDATCATYSPSLQLGVLDRSSDDLREPVLDVGCGRDAALVSYLRARGLEAYGIDRAAPAKPDGVAAVDWLDFDYGEGVWGTVISHLGFSLHFLRHHLADGPVTESLVFAHGQGLRAHPPVLAGRGRLRIRSRAAFRRRIAARTVLLVPPHLPSGRAPDTLPEGRAGATGLDLANATCVLRVA